MTNHDVDRQWFSWASIRFRDPVSRKLQWQCHNADWIKEPNFACGLNQGKYAELTTIGAVISSSASG